MTIQVIPYQNTTGDSMILLLDEENDKAESMTLATYQQRLADQEKQSGTL